MPDNYDKLLDQLLQAAMRTDGAEHVEVTIQVDVSASAVRVALKRRLAELNTTMEMLETPIDYKHVSVHKEKATGAMHIRLSKSAPRTNSFKFIVISP